MLCRIGGGLTLCSRRKLIFNKNLFNVISKSSQHLSLSDIAWKEEEISFTSQAISAAVACQPLLLISLFPFLPFYWIHISYFSSPFSPSCFSAFLWKYVVNTDRKKNGTKGLANVSCFLNKGRNGSGVLLCLFCFALLLKEGQNVNAWQQWDCTDNFFFFCSFI